MQRDQRDDAGFALGRLLVTAGAQTVLSGEEISAALGRHANGDWGEVGEEDRRENQRAVRAGERLLSVYRSHQGARFWVITEADRSATTVLLPDEY